MVFLGVYAYERGRYYFLRIAPDFIDLSLNRLLAGGAMVGALSVTLVGLTLWMWKHSANGGVYEKLLAAFLATTVFLALPIGLWLQTLPQLPRVTGPDTAFHRLLSMLVGIAVGIMVSVAVDQLRSLVDRLMAMVARARVVDLRSILDPAKVKNKSAAGIYSCAGIKVVSVIVFRLWLASLASIVSVVPWKTVGGIALLVWTAGVFAGLGYRVERSYTTRLCLADRFVADVHGDNLLLKSFDPKTGQILSPLRIVETKGVDLDSCSPRLVGATGLVLWE